MSQCVPSWDLEDPPNPPSNLLPSSSNHHHDSMLEYEVAELTWEKGQLSAHGLSHHRIGKPIPKYPSTAGTLESIVDQAKLLHPCRSANWLDSGPHRHRHRLATAVDALVPSAAAHGRHREDLASGIGSCEAGGEARKRARVGDGGRSHDSTRVTDTCGTDDFGFTNSVTPVQEDGDGGGGTPDTENTSFGGGGGSRPMTVVDDHDSVCHSQRSQSQREVAGEEEERVTEGRVRSAISKKRIRAAAIHNQSERKRRDRINQRLRTLQKLVPNSNKTDKASMLDEVIEYLKQLQAQVRMMSRISSIPPMMMPMSMQQFQVSMMAQMAQMAQMVQMGMGLGMMDMASLGRPGPAGIPPVLPTAAFLPMVGNSLDPSFDRIRQPCAFVACPAQQPMTMDAYQRMAASYHQMFQQTQPTNLK